MYEMLITEDTGGSVVDTLDIEFRELSYWVRTPASRQRLCCCCRSGNRRKSVDSARTQILHDVSGKFRAGELTAVLGPSGAGKTSLLSILAGFRRTGVEGEVLLNGRARSSSQGTAARRSCCLIPQDFAMMDALTVLETMHVAALLKLGTRAAIDTKIRETFTLLGLDSCINTSVGCLSGGEKKRLSCGVELLSNPPLMFFDEPTSGLDACSAHQVLSHLRALAHRDRRNIVCSIHQPGSRLFQAFDSVFVLAPGGRCLVRGPRDSLITNLANAGFQCPSFYNPADFVLEVATGERGDITNLLAISAQPEPRLTENKDEIAYETISMHGGLGVMVVEAKRVAWMARLRALALCQLNPKAPAVTAVQPVCNTWQQLSVLLGRATRCSFRDLHMARLRFAAHVLVGLMLGAMFYQIGNDAASLISNTGCIFFLMLFLFFSNAMPTVHTFPAEMSVMLRELQNGWYSVRSYYMARSIADLPLQPCEYRPFLQVWAVGLLLTLVAQSLGLLVGASSDVKMGIFLVPVISIPMLLFSGYFVRISDIPLYFQWLSHLSAFRYAFEACLIALYGYDREKLPCSLPYCHVRSPAKFLHELQLHEANYYECIVALVLFVVVLRIMLYIALKCRISASK
ncbi:hypothetical protein B566_EDAN005412 [Ephemera danica]|nr:hypothetical protein B566_EDAN005412 [Ephemera danica]